MAYPAYWDGCGSPIPPPPLVAVGVTPEGSETGTGVSLIPPLSPLPSSPVELSPQAKSPTEDPAAAARGVPPTCSNPVVPSTTTAPAAPSLHKGAPERLSMASLHSLTDQHSARSRGGGSRRSTPPSLEATP